jgi:hypothetical protein
MDLKPIIWIVVKGFMRDLQGPMEAVHRAALALGTANQLTNILRDVGEDAVERNRIYLPRDELDMFGISEAEVSHLQHKSLCDDRQSSDGDSLLAWMGGCYISLVMLHAGVVHVRTALLRAPIGSGSTRDQQICCRYNSRNTATAVHVWYYCHALHA